MWWFSYNSLSGLGRWRRLMALALRTIVLMLMVAANHLYRLIGVLYDEVMP